MKSVFIFSFVGLFIFSCNNPDNKIKNHAVKNEYPAYIIKSFMDGCLKDNSNPAVTQTLICSCLIEKIQRKYTVAQFNELGRLQKGPDWDKYQIFLNKAAEECINQNK